MSALDRANVAAIGDFASATRLADVPAGVVAFARLLLLDTLGALLGGLRHPPVRELARGLAASGPSGALLVLGTAATWLDADSGGSFHPQGHRLPPVPTAHPAPHCLPVLLLAAASGEVTDRRLLEVFLVATEVGLRSGTASSLRPGLHPHGVHGPSAAALAATLLRGGSPEELGRAFLLGSALPVAATLAVPVHGGTVRNVWTGLGACHGALAADLARDPAVDEGDAIGVHTALFDSAVCTDLSVEELVGGLGRRWRLLDSYLKPYACARWIHPTLDAVQLATAGSGTAAEDVLAVEVDTFAFAAGLTGLDIRSDMQARFSLPYCVATLLVDGTLDAGSFLPGQLARRSVAELAARVRVRADDASSAALPVERPARVAVRLRDGRTLRAEVRNARGNPASPLSGAEVEAKARSNVADLVDPTLLDAVVRDVLHPRGGDTWSTGLLARTVLGELVPASGGAQL
ncbi:MmgE/PrpD family protein [Geodermatophilus sp. DSM 44513]|uniref:MmgE/PrpD family protein n=1 Tax=Geodermatophilus sp. DSM 44513 TaxID=1528104 RepID=UPI00126C4409|nr:MmgE/PrpD family protein [Geodermatophilus sp. DSM 44513]WNV76175.1 MmgE/PrpD family protein [Geodermatophilus sp. DSM 44513]